MNTPLSPAISRLNDAFEMWCQADKYYFDPIGFRREINSCIQTLRTVTFVLQSNKEERPNFDSWYSSWQEKLKADRVLRWLVSARNVIVKQGDLKIFSTLTSSVVTSYYDPPKKIISHSCSQSTEQILARVKINKLPRNIREGGFLLLERSWVASDLPDFEMLDALSHSYKTLTDLLHSASQIIGISLDLNSQPRGMILPHEKRKLWVRLSDGKQQVYEQMEERLRAPDISSEIIDRYKLSNESMRPYPSGLIEIAEYYFDHARKVFLMDGFHTHLAIFLANDGIQNIINLRIDEYEDKYIVWRQVAAEAMRYKATIVLSIGEAWRAKANKKSSKVRVHELQDKEECLTLSAISIEGQSISLSAKISRNGKNITLGETERDDVQLMFFEPLRKIWGLA